MHATSPGLSSPSAAGAPNPGATGSPWAGGASFPASGSRPGFPPHGLDVLQQLQEPLHWLAGSVEHVGMGMLVGWLALRAMERLQLRWTWAAVGLGALLAVAPQPGPVQTVLGTAALFATFRARRAHRRELSFGGELAEAAQARTGPMHLLRQGAMRLASRLRRRRGDWLTGGELIVGEDDRHRPVRFPLISPASGLHTLVLGAAGSGKTVLLGWIAVRAIEARLATIVVDPKGDPALRERVAAAAAQAGRRFLEWSPDGPTVYNPFAEGSETEIADKALAGERFTEPHYLRQAQRYLGHAVRALHLAGREVSLARLADHLYPERLEELLRTLPEEQARRSFDYLDSLSTRQRSDLSGVRDRLSIMAESDVGRWLDPDTTGADRFELLGAIREGAVVLFTLRSDQRPLLMQMMGAAIVLDMQTATAALQSAPVPSVAVIDEFAALAAGQIGGLFGRARGAGMSLILATQEVSDLRTAGRDTLLEQVTGNLSSLISFRQTNPDSARLVSEHSGEQGAWRMTHTSDDRWSATRVTEKLVTPEQIRSLQRGEAAVIVHQGSNRGATLARMLPPDHAARRDR